MIPFYDFPHPYRLTETLSSLFWRVQFFKDPNLRREKNASNPYVRLKNESFFKGLHFIFESC